MVEIMARLDGELGKDATQDGISSTDSQQSRCPSARPRGLPRGRAPEGTGGEGVRPVGALPRALRLGTIASETRPRRGSREMLARSTAPGAAVGPHAPELPRREPTPRETPFARFAAVRSLAADG
jgi:hypothetical protein